MMRHVRLALVLVTAAAAVLMAQVIAPPPASSPHFAVASIRRNLSGSTDDRMNVAPGGRLVASNIPIRTLIRNVYRVQYAQLAGGPEWLATERWDILAAGASAANMDEMLERHGQEARSEYREQRCVTWRSGFHA